MGQQPKNPLKPQALALREQGLSYGEIGKRLGVNPKSVAGWKANADRKRRAKEAQLASKEQNTARLAPNPDKDPKLPTLSTDISADRKFSDSPSQAGNSGTSEQALRAKALAIYAEAETKHVSKRRREWADDVLRVTSKVGAGKTGKGVEAEAGSAYPGMGDEELMERGIASACAVLGGHRVDAIITRLKEQGQFYL